jgi:hypothetical protein
MCVCVCVCKYPTKTKKVNMLKHGSTSVFDCIQTTLPAALLTGMAAEKQPHSAHKCVKGNKPIQRKYLCHIYSIRQPSK